MQHIITTSTQRNVVDPVVYAGVAATPTVYAGLVHTMQFNQQLNSVCTSYACAIVSAFWAQFVFFLIVGHKKLN